MNLKNIKIISLFFIFFNSQSISNFVDRNTISSDLIIFSFNRPLQLYALLESIELYVKSLNKIFIIYRTSSHEFSNAYDEIKKMFPFINFMQQGANPRVDFKKLLLNAFHSSQARYIMFAVDDDLVKDSIDINECVDALETTLAYGFYLRLGKNLTHNYPNNEKYIIPNFTQVDRTILMFQFNKGSGAWAYPHNIDMTIFRKSNIQTFLETDGYTSPNTLEGSMTRISDLNAHGLCFETTKKFMVPLNIIQQDWYVQNENSFSTEELLQKWRQGLKMDIQPYFQYENSSIMCKMKPRFIMR